MMSEFLRSMIGHRVFFGFIIRGQQSLVIPGGRLGLVDAPHWAELSWLCGFYPNPSFGRLVGCHLAAVPVQQLQEACGRDGERRLRYARACSVPAGAVYHPAAADGRSAR